MAKIAWHTDIVVNGQGMNVKVVSGKPGRCASMIVRPDVGGAKSKKAMIRFMRKASELPSRCSAASLKKSVEHGIRATKAKWNQWHHETY